MPGRVVRWSECPACRKVLETTIGEPLAGTRCSAHPSSKPVRYEREPRGLRKVVPLNAAKRAS